MHVENAQTGPIHAPSTANINEKLNSLQHIIRTTAAKSQNSNSKYHKRWYYFRAQWHFGNVLRTNIIFLLLFAVLVLWLCNVVVLIGCCKLLITMKPNWFSIVQSMPHRKNDESLIRTRQWRDENLFRVCWPRRWTPLVVWWSEEVLQVFSDDVHSFVKRRRLTWRTLIYGWLCTDFYYWQ